MTTSTLGGKPYAEKAHVWLDDGKVASEKPRRGSLFYKRLQFSLVAACVAVMFGAFVAQAADEMPAKFVEYIESSGTQYIDLGNVLTSNTVATVDFVPMRNLSGETVFGKRATFAFITHDWIYVLGKRIVTEDYQKDSTLHSVVTIDVPQCKIFANGSELALSGHAGSENGASSAQAYLFWAGNESPARLRVYSCVISNDNQLAVDLYPCVDRNGEAGFYDTVSRRILRNAGTGAFVASDAESPVPSALQKDMLVVSATPEEYAVDSVSPAYGQYLFLKNGTNIVCTAPATWTDASGETMATCTGYKRYSYVASDKTWQDLDSGSGTTYSYTHADGAAIKLEWQWATEYAVVATAEGNGSVSTSKSWGAAGGTLTLTATPDAGSAFVQWTDSATGEILGTEPTMELTVTGPRQVIALFATPGHITWTDTINDYTPVIQAAIDEAEADAVISFDKGVYPLATPLAVNKQITLKGAENGGTVLKGAYDRKDNNVSQLTVSGGATLDHIAITGGKCSSGWSAYGDGVTITSGTLSWCVITNNVYNGAGNSGGVGVYANVANGATVTISHCKICDNTGYASHNVLPGVGLFVSGGGKFRMDNCLIANNRATCGNAAAANGAGGGLSISHSDAVVANCTIVDNLHIYRGGGVSIEGGKPQFVNCIIAKNTANNDASVHAPDVSSRAQLADDGTIKSTCLNAGTTNNLVSFGVTPFGGGGIAADPVFAKDSYELKFGSPAIGYGVALEGVTDGVDLNGVARSPDSVDLGCFAYVPSTEPDVQVALDRAIAFNDQAVGVEITHINPPAGKTLTDRVFVVSGAEEYPITVTDGVAVINRPGIWNVKVEVYDGGTKIAEALSGMTVKIGVRKAYVTSNAAATPVFPYATPETAATCLNDVNALCIDGTEIELDAGTHTISDRNDFTAAVHLHGAGRDLTWINGNGAKRFPAFYINNSGFVMENLSVTNYYRTNGGAVEIAANGGTVRNCRFAKNELHWAGGNCSGMTILSSGAKALIENCIFENLSYTAGDNCCYGIALRLEAGTARNCLFSNIITDNTKHSDSSIVAVSSGATLENCTIAGCSVKYFKNGSNDVCNPSVISTAGTVRNVLCCALEEICGESEEVPPWRYLAGKAADQVASCCFEGETKYGIDGADGTKIFFKQKTPYHIGARSSCRDAGQSQSWMEVGHDLDGKPRISGKSVDIGCYECQDGLGIAILLR